MNPAAILAVPVVFGLLVTFHELGHFLVAKLNGVRVLEFSIGFGTPLLRVERGETAYALRSIPLGGYVRLAGMDDGETGPRSFNSKPVWRRLTIIAAGAVTNLVLPALIFYVSFAAQSGGPITVETVTQGMPADQAGIKPGDHLLEAQGSMVRTLTGFRDAILSSGGHPVRIRFDRPGGSIEERDVVPVQQQGRWRIGVATSGGEFDPVQGLGDAASADVAGIRAIVGGLGTLVLGHVPGGIGGPCGLSGPVGIVRTTVHYAEAGWIPLLDFSAFLSLNLGILNLLPLPALDGGRVVFLLVEAIRRRPIDPLKEQKVHYIGLAVLLGLIALISYNDLVRLQIPFSQLIQGCQG